MKGPRAGRRREPAPSPRQMPPEAADAIRQALLEHPEWEQVEREPSRPVWLVWMPAAGACVALLAIAAIAIVALRQPVVTLEAANGAETAFERLALVAHERRAAIASQRHLSSSSRDEVVRWVRQHTGLSLSLADRRGRSDEQTFALEGAAIEEQGALHVGVVGYRIDGQPVTLVTAHEREAPPDVRWSLSSKRVRHRVDPATGATILMWANSGQAYALVSALPGTGQRACFICHADGRRDAVIASLAR